jgi:hypothetical protein
MICYRSDSDTHNFSTKNKDVFMTQPSVITLQNFQKKYWQRFTSYHFAQKEHMVPLVAAELFQAVSTMPVAFTQINGQFFLTGLQSLVPGLNLFVTPKGQWIGNYIPAAYRSYPFMLARVEGKNQKVLCVDESSGLVSDTTGEPFFDESGQLAKPVAEVFNFLRQTEDNRRLTNRAISVLADAGLITEWDLTVKAGDQNNKVAGLFRTNEVRLHELDGPAFLKLRAAQGLTIAYAQLFSMACIRIFEKLARVREQSKPPEKTAETQDLGKLLSTDDVIRF